MCCIALYMTVLHNCKIFSILNLKYQLFDPFAKLSNTWRKPLDILSDASEIEVIICLTWVYWCLTEVLYNFVQRGWFPVKWCIFPALKHICKSWIWFTLMHPCVNERAKNAALKNNKCWVFVNKLFKVINQNANRLVYC